MIIYFILSENHFGEPRLRIKPIEPVTDNADEGKYKILK